MAGGAIAAPAQAANLYTVTVRGTAGCVNPTGHNYIEATGELDGKTFTSQRWTWKNNYELKFTNVRPGRVPSGGGWAWIQVKCVVGDGGGQSWLEMYPTIWGRTLNF